LRVSEVVVGAAAPVEGEWLRELAWSLERLGARLSVVTPVRSTAPGRVRVSRVGDSIVVGVAQARPTGVARQLKAAVEAVVASVMLVVALPLLVACAVAVRLDSPGPAFFRQERVRDGGRTFAMLKLRTMAVDAESRRGDLEPLNEVGGGLFKMRSDPRVTRVGRVLRKLSLDELPQLVNVVRGQMSLVGPRPALPSEVAAYDRRALRRLEVKPGLTGLWQVSGRSRLSWDESVALDLDYVDNWSPRRDVKIALDTIRAVTGRDGAF
jgi:exopolysaccharide biosynthesis polyprenyl glycosylphosphotransferase